MKRLLRWLLTMAAITPLVVFTGNPRDPWLWALIFSFGVIGGIAMYSIDDDLARERFSPPNTGADRLSLRAVRLAALAAFLAALLDNWFGWTRVAAPFRGLGLVAFVLAFVLMIVALRANRFFSSVVRIQEERGHHVVQDGPYSIVRHPGYAGMIIAVPMIGLALDSWIAAATGLLYSALIFRRVLFEDHFLRANLTGYSGYATRVRHRLIPGVW